MLSIFQRGHASCLPKSWTSSQTACRQDRKCSLKFREQDSLLHSAKDRGDFRHLICLSSICSDCPSNHLPIAASQKACCIFQSVRYLVKGLKGYQGGCNFSASSRYVQVFLAATLRKQISWSKIDGCPFKMVSWSKIDGSSFKMVSWIFSLRLVVAGSTKKFSFQFGQGRASFAIKPRVLDSNKK